MIGHLLLIALGSTYLIHFSGHWLKLQAKPLAVTTRPVHFDNWCHLSLGTFYTCAGVLGA